MSIIRLLTLLTLVVCFIVAFNQSFAMASNNLLAHWALNEGEGVTALDKISGREDQVEYVFRDAKFKPSEEPLWKKGLIEGALLFDGYSTWITRDKNNFKDPRSELTIEAWVAPRAYEWGHEEKLSAIVSKHNKDENRGFILGMYRHGSWSLQVAINDFWYEVWAEDDEDIIPLNQWSHIVATVDTEKGQLNLYLNGRHISSADIPEGSIDSADEDLLIGKNNYPARIEPFSAGMFNGLIENLKIYDQALSSQEIEEKFKADIKRQEISEEELKEIKTETDFDRSRYKGDVHRPQYHFTPPEHWMNEPHAPIYFEGKYHLFYQFNPQGPYWSNIHWGHAVSDDLVHWEDVEVALRPEKGTLDPDGCWSGSATIDKQGNPVLFYTAGRDAESPNQRTALARSTYPEDKDVNLKDWEKHSRPVTFQGEQGWKGQFRDPFVWKDGDRWFQLVGSGKRNEDDQPVGGTALLYTSDDLIDWEHKGSIFTGDYEKYPRTGEVWELPVFLPLGENEQGVEKYVFLINPWFEERKEFQSRFVWYWIGEWDEENYKFIPDKKEPTLFDQGEHFTGPSGMVDKKNDRVVLFSIAQEFRRPEDQYEAGWAHNAGLPVTLDLNNNDNLQIEPIEELKSLRKERLLSIKENKNVEEINSMLNEIKGDMLEIKLEADISEAKYFGIKLRRAPKGKEETELFYDKKRSQLGVNRSKSSLDDNAPDSYKGGDFEISGDTLEAHIFIDKSMIEAYINKSKNLTTRSYPTREDALGLKLVVDNHLIIKSLDIWEMESIY